MSKADFLTSNLRFLFRGGYRMSGGHRPPAGHVVPEDFAGICVAGSPDPAGDAYVLHSLRTMHVNHVRLDYTYGSADNHTARLLEHLLGHSVKVLLHLVQPKHEAHQMDETPAQETWRAFLEATLKRWGARIEAVEIGSTVNRRKWAGYTPDTFMIAWRLAHEVAREHAVRLAGPNVTDFEPVYNVAFLDRMQRAEVLPDVHTDNLFAERATEPETYDHKIVGHACAPLIKYNVIKKARLLQRVAERYEVPATWSTHVAWSKRRIDRILSDVEGKQADYLSRYLLLAAASGALARVYWGPMIGQREGVIDDGTNEYPEPIPHVTLYDRAPGEVTRYRVRPALHAMKTFATLIPGARYVGRLNHSFGLEVHAFAARDELIHAVWSMNGCGADWSVLYQPQDLADAKWIARDGDRLDERPALVTESPCYLCWPADRAVAVSSAARVLPNLAVHEPVHPYQGAGWRGAVVGETSDERQTLLRLIAPHRLKDGERKEVLRDARNAVWRIADPREPDRSLVVKRALVTKWHKKVLDCLKPSKARRSWNGACELLRRGIETPRPIAFFEQFKNPALMENFYLCAFEPGHRSVRQYFSAYAQGADAHEGMPAGAFYEALAAFLLNMHRRGVYFRDLSAGNILVLDKEGGGIRFSLIDTARARFYDKPVSLRQRLSDLKRICHPLHWSGRNHFVGLYLKALGESFTPIRQVPFRLYDIKHRIKNRMKGK